MVCVSIIDTVTVKYNVHARVHVELRGASLAVGTVGKVMRVPLSTQADTN